MRAMARALINGVRNVVGWIAFGLYYIYWAVRMVVWILIEHHKIMLEMLRDIQDGEDME